MKNLIFTMIFVSVSLAFAKDVKKYNDKENLIYSKDSDGNEIWYGYHINGKVAVIHSKNKSGYEEWYSYDSKGNELHVKYSDGIECWNEYDERGNLINSRTNNGYQEWYAYDEDGRRIYYKNVIGDEIRYEYDRHGNQYSKQERATYWEPSKPVKMVVLTDDGLPLRYRKSPVDGEVLGNFKNETIVYATKRTAQKYQTDGRTDYWYFVHSEPDTENEGWIFGGYLEIWE